MEEVEQVMVGTRRGDDNVAVGVRKRCICDDDDDDNLHGDHSSWNPNQWSWDPVGFLPHQAEAASLTPPDPNTPTTPQHPNKRLRLCSNYPICQVDNCHQLLSPAAKDYYRRHKVCELHSKSTHALVSNHLQRFCQQCSRFHPLSEFDEGKRSCRRRLAGHNRRRRKSQPDVVASHLQLPANHHTSATNNLDTFTLLTNLSRTHGKNDNPGNNATLMPDGGQLIQILSKMNSLPLPADLVPKLSNVGSFSRKHADKSLSEQQNKLHESPTRDLLTVLSATLAGSDPNSLRTTQSLKSSQSSDSDKSKLTSVDQVTGADMQTRLPVEFRATAGEICSSRYRSPVEDSLYPIEEANLSLPLQLFSSSPEDDSPPKLASSRKYLSSDNSNPIVDRSPSSSPPVVRKLFPVDSAGHLKLEMMSSDRNANGNVECTSSQGCISPLDLFRDSSRVADRTLFQNSHLQVQSSSSSGSDHSPSSQDSDARSRTARISFKLFDKDPSHFPMTLRTQIYNWLSNVPSEMESYIRPGCVVLSVYMSMNSAAWEQLERNLLQLVESLVQDSTSDFWRSGRFLLHAGRKLASHKHGKIRLCKSWRIWTSPELIAVSPVAIVGGQETSLLLRGRNLNNAGTKIYCTFMGGYPSKELEGSSLTGAGVVYDAINVDGFTIDGVFGRCFIEVENGFKGNSFPVIIANVAICKELKLLESEFNEEDSNADISSEEHTQDLEQTRSREDVVHFLNELGWLFQRTHLSSKLKLPDYSLKRFKFLLIFSIERDYAALVKTVLDFLVERNMDGVGLSKQSLDVLSETQLLSRAVKRKCKRMVELLLHYSIVSQDGAYKTFAFTPNLVGPCGITPLHLAASTSDSVDLVDALTNDPQEIGVSCWTSLSDESGQSPYAYAVLTNNHLYNTLVARKIADKRNVHVSVSIGNEIEQEAMPAKKNEVEVISQYQHGRKSCNNCATMAAKYNRRFMGSQSLLQRPYVHSMLVIAAVCVCVCVFFRGAPDIGSVAPFKWENLEFGTI